LIFRWIDSCPAAAQPRDRARAPGASLIYLKTTRFLAAAKGVDVPPGPYRARAVDSGGTRLVFDITTQNWAEAGEFHLSLGPFRQVVKDYFQILRKLFRRGFEKHAAQPDRDDRYGRRGIHNEVCAGAGARNGL